MYFALLICLVFNLEIYVNPDEEICGEILLTVLSVDEYGVAGIAFLDFDENIKEQMIKIIMETAIANTVNNIYCLFFDIFFNLEFESSSDIDK